MSTANNVAHPSSSADGVAWDLSDLYSGLDDPQIDQDLRNAYLVQFLELLRSYCE